jgi:two-component system nitrogen regulation response regulator GlnG
LNVIRLRLPALRERREDIAVLTRFFLQKSARELGVDAKRITDPALQQLMAFDFPGNVRQLENLCHWVTVMAPSQVIEAKDLPPEFLTRPEPGAATSDGVAPASASVAVPPLAAAGAREAPPETSAGPSWLGDLQREARSLLEAGVPGCGMRCRASSKAS